MHVHKQSVESQLKAIANDAAKRADYKAKLLKLVEAMGDED